MRKIIKWFAFWLVLVLIIYGIISMSIPINPAKRADGSSILGNRTLSKTQNVLLLGLDESGKRTDTIMLLHLDNTNKKISILSIPRDTKIENGSKINAAYSRADREDATIKEVESLTGISINYYVTLKPNAFRKIIDYFGGIDYNVPMNMKYTSSDGKFKIDLSKGWQHLNGSQAEQLVRFRKGYITQDIGRVGTQQDFIKELIKQKMTTKNFLRIGKIIDECKKYFHTNYSYGKLMGAVMSYRKLDFDKDIKSYTVPGEPSKSGISYWLVDKGKLKNIM